MSSIKTTQIDGDVSVGRNVAIGGGVTVQGKTQLKGSVKIDGWLDAKNIKAANKGIFTTVLKLREAFPNPHEGWWALVGNSLPAHLHIAEGGDWVPQMNNGNPVLTGEPTIDSEQYNEAVAELQSDLLALNAEVNGQGTPATGGIRQTVERVDADLTLAKNSILSSQGDISTIQNAINAIESDVATLLAFKATKGQAGGIAPLDSDRKIPATYLPAYVDDVIEFSHTVEGVVAQMTDYDGSPTSDEGNVVVYDSTNHRFLLCVPDGEGDCTYYVGWTGVEPWGTASPNGVIPNVGKVYIDIAQNITYRWSGNRLVAIGSDLALGYTSGTAFPGDAGRTMQRAVDQLQTDVETLQEFSEALDFSLDARSVLNVNKFLDMPGRELTFSVVLDRIALLDAAVRAKIQIPGIVLTFLSANGWQSKQWTNGADWSSESNWTDFGANGESIGNTINVNALCGGDSYNLGTAVQAILDLEQESGLSYFKSGVVITFKTTDTDVNSRPVWLAYQYTRELADLLGSPSDLSPWVAFGGGGSGSVETVDETEEGSSAPFSAGGAHNLASHAIGGFDEESDEEYIYYKGVNLKGEQMPDVELRIPKNTGGGGGSSDGSTLSIYFEEAAPTVAFGSDIIINAALRSVSYPDGNEVLGVIRNISIVDASTGLTLISEDMNEVGSASATDFKFALDFTGYFSSAASKSFFVQATDADGNTKRKAITIVAVDVTVQQPMALHYTSSTALVVGGGTKTIGQFYKFPNNSSSILATVEMFYNGQWRTLGEATVSDSYTKSISVNPNNVFGGNEVLQHGAYPVRIYGTEIKSGVRGNVIYSTIFCVDQNNSTPLVGIRFNDVNNGTLRLYDNFTVEVAAYTPGRTETPIDVYYGSELVTSVEAMIAETVRVNRQVQGVASDGTASIVVHAESGASRTNDITIRVQGSAIGAVIKEGALFGFDFASRSNSESDHSIVNNGFSLVVEGSNYSSNGFVDYLGERCLRIAENVTAEIPGYRPFGTAAVENTNGCAIQMAFATKNIKDSEAKLIECYDPDSGAGFYVCGNKVVLACKTGQPQELTRSFRCGEKITLAVVVEPSTIYVSRGGSNYSCLKLYLNGEEVGCIGYISSSGAILSTKTIKFNGVDGDLYLYYMLAYESHYEWAQAFQNYLCKLTDTPAMIAEFEAENVLDTQNRPTIEGLAARKIPYYVVVADQSTFNAFDTDIDTSTKFSCTLFYYDPVRPWRSFKAVNVQWRRQGTTSAKRPIKNDRFYLKKNSGWQVTPIYPDYDNADALISYALMALGCVRVGESSIPVSVITVKVDFSDSSNANDCGVCDLMNATYRALGPAYMTPAQRAFDGTWDKGDVHLTGLQMNHSTANHPIAAFRATMESLTDAWFHAKGNWKEDKGEQVALGFKDTPGYNKGCKNYGDFVEYFGTDGETLDQIEMRFRNDETVDNSKLYLLSLYCGQNYRFMKYVSGAWQVQTGSMRQVNGRWQITGTVLNPVSGYELLSYDGLDWWQGVGSIADMMAPTTAESSWVTKLKLGQSSYPIWTRYFECMIDDDQLQIDLALGRKVPYDLYQMLVFCDSCDYSKQELADTWQNIWRTQMWKYASPHSMVAYYLFTDYMAAVDQQAKNMQPMWFLEDGCYVENGIYHGVNGMEARRMYLNKIYDCDTCNSKDNDGGNTIDAEVDPGDLTSSAYAGRGSVLWNNIRGQQMMNIDQNGNTITLAGVAETMRSLPDTLGIGAGPFSPKGAHHYFITERMGKWPKVVSSYDGERKYIKYTGYSDLYFYALQGLGLTSLPAFIEQRWRIRDGYYRCGDFKAESGYIGGRIGAKDNAVIRFKAAKSGYFGIGNDSGNITEGIYLNAGEEGVFSNFQHGENIMLYIYQADRMSELDLSEISIDPQFGNTLSKMALLQKLKLGSATHGSWTMSPGNTGYMTNLDLGDMPFLTELDVRNTEVTSITASRCPRLVSLLANDTQLATVSLAETAPIETLALPATMTEIVLNNLPRLTYPGGLTIGGMNRVTKVYLKDCPNVDTMTLLQQIVESGSLRTVRIPNVNATASVEMLRAIKDSGAIGLDANGNAYDESGQCSGITGRWILTELVEDSEVAELQAYFPEVTVHNSQFSVVMYNDEVEDSENMSNLENRTGYAFGNTYVPSGHFLRIEQASHAYKGVYNDVNEAMRLEQLSDDNYNYLADGVTSIDLTDTGGMGYDIFKLLPQYWYKGVNDFKNQKKYFIASSLENEPISSASRITRKLLSEILVEEFTAVALSNNPVGNTVQTTVNANHNTYSIDVDGMKQVRFPGTNSNLIGGAFVDAEDKVISLFNMYVTHSLFDFTPGDYVFTDVPQGAKKFIFSAPRNNDEQEAIAVDSSAVEAIEPDWVHPDDKDFRRLVGVYVASVDNLSRLRSISGATPKRGDDTSTTSQAWTYDADGNVTNRAVPTGLHYTAKDFLNLAKMRGNGYQSIDYEMSKDVANLILAHVGTRDVQTYVGYGASSSATTGTNWNDKGNKTFRNSSLSGNLAFGIQNFIACTYEWMEHVAVNVASFKNFKKNKHVAANGDTVNHVWHIYNPATDTERTVQGINNSGYCVGRVKFGRHCDIIPSKLTSDNSQWNRWFGDIFYYSAATGRVVLRGGYIANAHSGLVYAYASYASSYSNSSYGARLAFTGKIIIEGEEDENNENAES